MPGPHGAPDFFTESDIDTLFHHAYEVHYNSSRTGVRLIGPKPAWARSDGGEAGLHPSNIHDNAYAFGTLDFTGDMPVLLGPDGPSLGGFVCPVTVIDADLWKLGQLRAGDRVRFRAVTAGPCGDRRSRAEEAAIERLAPSRGQGPGMRPPSPSTCARRRWPTETAAACTRPTSPCPARRRPLHADRVRRQRARYRPRACACTRSCACIAGRPALPASRS